MPKIFSESDKEIIRNKLLEEGIKALETKHYRNISLDDITSSMGIAKGTFYHFFLQKRDFSTKLCIISKKEIVRN